jgi:tRNA (guanine37-N1)-methyltransferase
VIIDVVTIFPAMIEASLVDGVVGRARTRGVVDIRAWDLREFTDDRHRTVDDVPYGGGAGMVMRAEPIVRAVEAIAERRGTTAPVVLMSPQGRPFTHADAERLSHAGRLVVICGRYEGVDQRVTDELGAEEISIGDYVLSGGELPALVVVDAIARLVPGVVGDPASVEADSFVAGRLDHPHYTRPAVFRGRAVPDVLLSGHHAEIARWRRLEGLRRTLERRPELIDAASLSSDERHEWEAFLKEKASHEGD